MTFEETLNMLNLDGELPVQELRRLKTMWLAGRASKEQCETQVIWKGQDCEPRTDDKRNLEGLQGPTQRTKQAGSAISHVIVG